MSTSRLLWFFLWRITAWLISSGIGVGVAVAVLIEISGYAGRGVAQVVGALGRGAFIGGFLGCFRALLAA